MLIFIAKILSADFLLNFKVAEFEHELEPGDLAGNIVIITFAFSQSILWMLYLCC